MRENSSFARFLAVVLSIWTAMNLYVFWRLASVPLIATHVSRPLFLATAIVLWVIYPLARVLSARGWDSLSLVLEWIGTTWIGATLLLLTTFLAADVVTLGGWLFAGAVPMIRTVAAVLGFSLAFIALLNALRPPVLREYEIVMQGLPRERDGTRLLQLTDLHLGTLLHHRWLGRLIHRVDALHPDLIVIVGDLVDGNAEHVQSLVPALRKMHAPLGVWAVTGNHEYYAGLERSVSVFENAGIRLLRDEHREAAPGLVLAGVDDLTVRRGSVAGSDAIKKSLAGREPGATILLSHSPIDAGIAAENGAGLMLSGHTHHGQIWPFGYLVRSQYPMLGGRYTVRGMPVIVSRGAGTWGPRMRLWHPGEVVLIHLRCPA
jgi:predicted MPP superfamily phosphohydrolase